MLLGSDGHPVERESRLNELEGLSLGVAGKRALWEALRELPEFAGSPDFDFAALSQRAETQLLELETLRREAAAQALRM
jgi:NADH dehydrogenase/NADH:ubiquinone oxidoreductase subunit G